MALAFDPLPHHAVGPTRRRSDNREIEIRRQGVFFRQQSVPRRQFPTQEGHRFHGYRQAGVNYRETFGEDAKELAQTPLAAEIRAAVERHEEPLDEVLGTMLSAQLPGTEVIDGALSQMRAIRRGNEENAILSFNASHKNIKEAIKRGADLAPALTESASGRVAMPQTSSGRMA